MAFEAALSDSHPSGVMRGPRSAARGMREVSKNSSRSARKSAKLSMAEARGIPRNDGRSLSELSQEERSKISAVAESKARAKTREPVTGRLGRPRTIKEDAPSPTVPNATEYVDRVADTLTILYNRGYITQLQYSAGERYRNAFEMTSASMGGAMDYDRVRGASGGAPSPSDTYLQAAEVCSHVRKKLYPRDFAVVHRVCVQGLNFDTIARQLSHPEYGISMDRKEAAQRLSAALSVLGADWWPHAAPRIDARTGDVSVPMRVYLNEKATNTDAPIERLPVAHATRNQVFISDKDTPPPPPKKKAK